MDAFPPEINDQIIRELMGHQKPRKPPRSDRLVEYATVSRSFQLAVEKWTFRSIRVNTFRGFRQSHFKAAFTLPSPTFSSTHSTRTQVVTNRRAALRDLTLGSGITWGQGSSVLSEVKDLFSFLSTWTESDRFQGGNGDLSEPGIKLTFDSFPPSNLSSGWWFDPRFAPPATPIITKLVFSRSDEMEKCPAGPPALAMLTQALPNLKSLSWNHLARTWGLVKSNALTNSITSCIDGGHLRNLTCLYLQICGPDERFDPFNPGQSVHENPLIVATRQLSRLPALQKLWLNGDFPMEKKLFEYDAEISQNTKIWPCLRLFQLETTFVTANGQWALVNPNNPEDTDGSMNDNPSRSKPVDGVLAPFICALARAVLRMPKLERLQWKAETWDYSPYCGHSNGRAAIVVVCLPPWFRTKSRKLSRNEEPSRHRWEIVFGGKFPKWAIPPEIRILLGEGNVHFSRKKRIETQFKGGDIDKSFQFLSLSSSLP